MGLHGQFNSMFSEEPHLSSAKPKLRSTLGTLLIRLLSEATNPRVAKPIQFDGTPTSLIIFVSVFILSSPCNVPPDSSPFQDNQTVGRVETVHL